jgi:lipopolysaccharide biosynthesis regulator YciM
MQNANALIIGVLVLLVAGVLLLPLLSRRQRRGLASRLARYQAITEALLADDLNEARARLKEVIRADTDDAGAYLKLAQILRRQGELERAVAVRRSLLARDIKDRAFRRDLLAGLVEDLISLQRYPEARPIADTLRRVDRQHPVLWQLEMQEALERQDWDAALHALDMLRRLGALPRPLEGARLRAWVARARAGEGDLREARKILEEAVRHDPSYVPAWLLLGDLWVREGEHARAVDIWTRLLKRQPAASLYLVDRLEKAYFELGHFGDLERLYESFLAADGGHTGPLRLALARIALRKGDPDRGLTLIDDLLQQEPTNRAARSWRLFLLGETGREEELRQALREAAIVAIARPEGPACPSCGKPVDAVAVRCPECSAWLPDPVSPAVPAGPDRA